MYAVTWFSAGSWPLMCINTAAKRNEPLFITHLYKRGGIRDGPMLGRASPFVLLTDGVSSGCVLHLCGALGLQKRAHWSRTWSTSDMRAVVLRHRIHSGETALPQRCNSCLHQLPNHMLGLNSHSFPICHWTYKNWSHGSIYSRRKFEAHKLVKEKYLSQWWKACRAKERAWGSNDQGCMHIMHQKVFCFFGISALFIPLFLLFKSISSSTGSEPQIR